MTDQFFDQTPIDDPFADQGKIYKFDDGTLSPRFYKPIPIAEAHEIIVKQKGVPLVPEFRLSEVAPSRRWPVLPSGELIPQEDFRSLYLQTRAAYFTEAGESPPDLSSEPVPTVQFYVRHRVARTHERPRLEVITRQYDSDGEIKPLHNQDGTLASEAEGTRPSGPFVPKPDAKPEVVSPGDLEQQIADMRREIMELAQRNQVLENESATRPAPDENGLELPAAERKVKARCGEFMLTTKLGNHSRHCKLCKELKAKAEAEAKE